MVAHGRVEVFRNGDTWAEWRCHGMVAHGRMETSSLAQGQDGDTVGWWHRDRMEMWWDGGTWKGGDIQFGTGTGWRCGGMVAQG